MSTVAATLALGRRRILALDAQMAEALVQQYGIAWRAVARELEVLEGQIQAALSSGQQISPAWLHRQAWWQERLASIDRQMSRFSTDGANVLTRTQITAVRIAQTTGLDVANTIGTAFPATVHADAFERWVTMLQPDSPLSGVLDRYGERVRASITRNMTEGLGAGEGTSTITRRIMREVGDDAVEGRISTLVRTETMRAYRGAHHMQMSAIGETVPGTHEWEWFASLSSRTCPACLSRHGRRFPFTQYPDHQHPACRCVVRLIIEGSGLGVRETGEEWFARQPEKLQRKVLRTGDRYDAYQDGATLDDFTGIRRNEAWGDSVTVLPMSKVRRAA